MEKSEFNALVEQYKNEMIELFNLKKNDSQDEGKDIVEMSSDKNDVNGGEDNQISDTSAIEILEDNNHQIPNDESDA